jgi:hypothetical protein
MSQAKQAILSRVKTIALGNTNRGFKHVASDLCNELGRKAAKDIASGTYLSVATVQRVMDCPEGYRPQSETLERIFIYCNAQVSFAEVAIKGKYANQPKEEK